MSDNTLPNNPEPLNTDHSPLVPTDREMGHAPLIQLNNLMNELKAVSSPDQGISGVTEPIDNQLAIVRLGMAGCLHTALRCKHAATAQHGLRVAMTCSAWSIQMGLPDQQRDLIEVAALLHDIGLIGLPDDVFFKQGKLDSDETRAVIQARLMSVEILKDACPDPSIPGIIESIGAWYDGSRTGFRLSGDEIPLEARMISVAEAFDAMTTSSIYRSALSHEMAMQELIACSGTQFDANLVSQFTEFQSTNRSTLRDEVSRRWFNLLPEESGDLHWERKSTIPTPFDDAYSRRFESKMLSDMHDAVIFVDSEHRVTHWNRGAERLTGIPSHSALQTPICKVLEMRDEHSTEISPKSCEDCPVGCTMFAGVASIRRLKIMGRKNELIPVDCHAMPVNGDRNERLGAIIMFHDATPQISLEERCQSLNERTRLDPMTRVANRAEFDRFHPPFIAAHRQQNAPCSLIICDIDHFKRVNDTFGHQAGDKVIQALAMVMQNECRTGDLVARYGGEEFVMLCADNDIETATQRAERMRQAFGRQLFPEMDNLSSYASFGVTELQPGDTPETMLRRSDRGLLMAKSKGRNMVVQLGSGSGMEEKPLVPAAPKPKSMPGTFGIDSAICQEMQMSGPVGSLIEKLRGFVADHRAEIVQTCDNVVWMTIEQKTPDTRRASDRPAMFRLFMELEERFGTVGAPATDRDISSNSARHTFARITISQLASRNRHKKNHEDFARQLLISLKSYLMPLKSGMIQLTRIPECPTAKQSGLLQRIVGMFRHRKKLQLTDPSPHDKIETTKHQ